MTKRILLIFASLLLTACGLLDDNSSPPPTLHTAAQTQLAAEEPTTTSDAEATSAPTILAPTDPAQGPTPTETEEPPTPSPTTEPTDAPPPTETPTVEPTEIPREDIPYSSVETLMVVAELYVGAALDTRMPEDESRFRFTLKLQQGNHVIVQLQRLSGGENLTLTLYDPAGNELEYLATGSTRNVVFTNPLTVQETGDYTVLVTGEGASYQLAVIDTSANAGARPTLVKVGTLVPVTVAPTDSQPPTQAPSAGGGRLELNQTIRSEIMEPAESHRYTLAGTSGEVVKIVVNPDPSSPGTLDPFISIQAPNSEIVAENDDWRPGIQDAYVEYTFAATGIYTIYVSSTDGQGTGFYYLSASNGFTLRDVERGEILPDESVTSQLETYGARDIWEAELEAGDVIDVSANAIDPASFDIMVEVVAPNGESWFDDDGGEGTNAFIAGVEAPVSGVYRIHIAGNNNASRGDYELRWSQSGE